MVAKTTVGRGGETAEVEVSREREGEGEGEEWKKEWKGVNGGARQNENGG